MDFIIVYGASVIAAASAVLAITRLRAIHAILFLVVSFMSIGALFYSLGAPFVAVLEVITYAGAIMVLFMFAIMLLNLGPGAFALEKRLQPPRSWIAPICIGALLFAEIAFVCIRGNLRVTAAVHRIDAQAVGIALFGPYKAAVIAVSFILLAGLIGAFHLGRPSKTNEEAR